jgi:hypothetical protein
MYQPLHRHRPAHRWTNGDLAAKVGENLGLPPDEEQRWILDTIFAEKAPDVPASFEVGIISPRQNIKTSTLGIAALADLFVFGVERHLWTAHHGDTLKGTFQDFRAWIKSNPEYDDQVTFYEGHQDMSIVHKETGATIDFQSRTGKAGRGLTGVKRITLDEALYLEPKHVGAIYPTMLTRRGAQVRIGSSAGLLTSEQLRRIRDRGRTGKDKRLSYVEYGAKRKLCLHADCSHVVGTPGCALDDRDLWWQANCALWPGRVLEESIEDQRNSMPPAEFMREFLSWWEDPESLGGAIPLAQWLDLKDPDAAQGAVPVFGLDVAEDRSSWVAAAWRRADGAAQVMLANDGQPMPAHRVIEECARLSDEWSAKVVAARSFEKDLAEAGVQALCLSSADFAAACGLFADAVTAGKVRHGNQPALNMAVKSARWRSAGTSGERAFQLKDMPEVGPVVAVVRALHGLKVGYTPPSPRRVQAAPSRLAPIGF